jgi:hypothetical protein
MEQGAWSVERGANPHICKFGPVSFAMPHALCSMRLFIFALTGWKKLIYIHTYFLSGKKECPHPPIGWASTFSSRGD